VIAKMFNMRLLNIRHPKLNQREERLVSAMQLLGDQTRFKIFKLLMSGKDMCVTEIAGALGVSVPAVSQHFRIFELVGLVDKQRNGQKIRYQLKTDDQLVAKLIRIV
jgi:ArsR family transcriptional regulator